MIINRFFIPDEKLIESIVDYASGRIIVDIGFGSGELLIELKNKGAKVFGIEAFIDDDVALKLSLNNIHYIPGQVQNYSGLIRKLKEKGILLFARPCHSNFVEDCLDIKSSETEALYITIPENLNRYNDLGEYRKLAKQVYLEGNSIDNEIILSIC